MFVVPKIGHSIQNVMLVSLLWCNEASEQNVGILLRVIRYLQAETEITAFKIPTNRTKQ